MKMKIKLMMTALIFANCAVAQAKIPPITVFASSPENESEIRDMLECSKSKDPEQCLKDKGYLPDGRKTRPDEGGKKPEGKFL